MIAKKIIISGIVQKVGMRYFIMKNSRRLNIFGYAKNLPDKTVECLLIGQENDIQELLNIIKTKSPGSIENIIIQDYDIQQAQGWIGKFEIL